MRDVGLLADAFDPGALVEQFRATNPGLGGICTFVGEVRSDTGVEVLELSHYEPLTLPSMEELADKAFVRFDLMGLLMIHRVGQMLPGEPIVCVSAAAKHRRAAIDAVDYCMDHLKAAAWFWKREKRDGEWSWIEPRSDDYADLARWK